MEDVLRAITIEESAPVDVDNKEDKIFVSSSPNNNVYAYMNQKPKWWKKVAGRRGTKGQRSCISRMTQLGYVLPKLDKYQHYIDFSALFNGRNDTSQSTNCVLVPKSSDVYRGDERVVLEIGFGLGDNLLSNAMMFPDICFLGAEVHQPGVATMLQRMEQSMKSGIYWVGQNWWRDIDIEKDIINTSSHPYSNVRIYPGDGVRCLRFIQDSSLDAVYLTFPDPWSEEKDIQWRVIQTETVELLGKKLKSGGHFYLATDVNIFSDWTRKIFSQVSGESGCWKEIIPCPDRMKWLPIISKYETKGLDEGNHTLCQCWKRQG